MKKIISLIGFIYCGLNIFSQVELNPSDLSFETNAKLEYDRGGNNEIPVLTLRNTQVNSLGGQLPIFFNGRIVYDSYVHRFMNNGVRLFDVKNSGIVFENEADLYWKNSAGTEIPTITVHSDNRLYIDSPTETVFRHRPDVNTINENIRFTAAGDINFSGDITSADFFTGYALSRGTTSRLNLNTYELGGYLSNADPQGFFGSPANSPNTIGGSWDMIRLSGINDADLFSWSFGLIDTVEFDGDTGTIDDYDCHDCFSMTYSTDWTNFKVKRVIDRDGHAHAFFANESNPTIVNPDDSPQKSKYSALDKIMGLHIDTNNKSNIQEPQISLDKAKKLLPHAFVTITNRETNEKEHFVSYEKMIPTLLKAIQEQQEQIATLQRALHKNTQ